jgi:hypothetical protein
MRKIRVGFFMKMKFSINKYLQAIYKSRSGLWKIGTSCNQRPVRWFLGEICDFSFTGVEFHTVSSAPALCGSNARPQNTSVVVLIFVGSFDFDIVTKSYTVGSCITLG